MLAQGLFSDQWLLVVSINLAWRGCFFGLVETPFFVGRLLDVIQVNGKMRSSHMQKWSDRSLLLVGETFMPAHPSTIGPEEPNGSQEKLC